MSSRRFSLTPPAPFDLEVVARSHGWFDLPPFVWDPRRGRLSFSTLAEGEPVTVAVAMAVGKTGPILRGEVAAFSNIGKAVAFAARRIAASCLRLDEDLGEFYELVSGDARLGWVAERGAGRILRAPTVFEDLIKIVCTTNCSWAFTRVMVGRLVDLLGEPAPGGKTFPTAETMARRPPTFYRDRIRAGYRAPHLARLARMVARGEIDPESWRRSRRSAEDLRRELLALPGVGPYATAHMLRMLGHHAYPGIDSWCRSTFRSIYQLARAPSDQSIVRRYRRFGRWLGLAMWMDLTRHWHVGRQVGWP